MNQQTIKLDDGREVCLSYGGPLQRGLGIPHDWVGGLTSIVY